MVPNPGSLYFYGASHWGSRVEPTATDQSIYAMKNILKGEVSEQICISAINNGMRRCFVYTARQYQKDTKSRYPVLYLQHGGRVDEIGWYNQGRANLIILDNLIAEGKPFIIVMGNGDWTWPEASQQSLEANGQKGDGLIFSRIQTQTSSNKMV